MEIENAKKQSANGEDPFLHRCDSICLKMKIYAFSVGVIMASHQRSRDFILWDKSVVTGMQIKESYT